MKKKWFILIILILLAIVSYNYIYKNHRDIANETSHFKLTAADISSEFAINPTNSEIKYLNKTIEVTGTITNLNPNNLTLNNKVFCQFSNRIQKTLSNNSQIKVKGRFIGYDDLLEEIKLDQCTIIQ
ncbi:OB-fold protein [Changchengzhania lutea]|uniref:OB-fold protein n=1 Tax=Changchengzhania lutea TaxID=2049305 RepID=UPI00115D0626|nr:hypothetical protein [Changchengzhania lutea]